MTLETVREVLLWSALINYGVMLWWFLAFCLAHDWIYRLHSKWFRLSVEAFDAIHYASMAAYKVGVLLLNLVPYAALSMVA
jgi:hypothetical protein